MSEEELLLSIEFYKDKIVVNNPKEGRKIPLSLEEFEKLVDYIKIVLGEIRGFKRVAKMRKEAK